MFELYVLKSFLNKVPNPDKNTQVIDFSETLRNFLSNSLVVCIQIIRGFFGCKKRIGLDRQCYFRKVEKIIALRENYLSLVDAF